MITLMKYLAFLFINIKTNSKPLNVGLIHRYSNSCEEDNKKVNKQIQGCKWALEKNTECLQHKYWKKDWILK